MVISVSRRTDVPAFHSEWFMDRILKDYVKVVNPFNPKQIKIVDLKPESVDVMVFWTRNAKPIIKHLSRLSDLGYDFYFLYTITGYPKLIEPNLPSIESAVNTISELVEKIGYGKVIWRYDPVI